MLQDILSEREKPFELITLFARKEPVVLRQSWMLNGSRPDADRRDVVLYRDEAATDFYVRYPWYLSSIPTRRNNKVTLNCFPYLLTWLDDLSFPDDEAMLAHWRENNRFWPGGPHSKPLVPWSRGQRH